MSPAILNLFGRSPIHPLQKHMKKVNECVLALMPFFEKVMEEDSAKIEKGQQEIARLEYEADELKRDLRLSLPRKFFLAIPRTDVLDLLAKQDLIANRAKDISGLVLGRKMRFPKTVQESFTALLKRSIDAVKYANKVIRELDELFEAGFSGGEASYVEALIDELHEIERDTDHLQIEVRKAIFDIESKWPPVDVIFLYKVVEWTGDLADRARHVGDRLQILLAQ